MKVLVIGAYTKSLITFRGHMLRIFYVKGHEVIAIAPDSNEEVETTLAEWGVQYVNVFFKRVGSCPIQDMQSLWALYTTIKRIKPDLVFSYTIKPVIYGSIAASWAGVPKIYSMITGLGWTFNSAPGIKGKLLRRMVIQLYKISAKRNNALIFQNPDDQNLFIQLGIVKPGKTHRIYGSGVDLSHYSYSTPPLDPVRFLFIGRLIKEKGLLEFVEACRILKSQYPDIQCDVLGRLDTNPGGITTECLTAYSEAEIVKFHGQQEDVRPFLEQASVFVLPSYYGEGTPRTALEAMATGRPLIMGDSPGCRETVKGGENGFLVPVRNPAALAVLMEKFITNPDFITPMGQKSRQIAEEKYDVHKVNQDIIKILGL